MSDKKKPKDKDVVVPDKDVVIDKKSKDSFKKSLSSLLTKKIEKNRHERVE